MFGRTILSHELKQHPEQWVPGGTYIIADSAYPLRTYLIKAFPHHGILGHQEKHFNKILSSTRMIVEQAFGLLKGRWRILLNELYCRDLERIVRVIHACCILHNFCIDNGDILSIEDFEIDNEENEGNEAIISDDEERIAGVQKREYLADYLMNV